MTIKKLLYNNSGNILGVLFMEKNYKCAEIELIRLSVDDIISTSSDDKLDPWEGEEGNG